MQKIWQGLASVFGIIFIIIWSNTCHAAAGTSTPAPTQSWEALLGKVEPRPMLGLGMWTYHLKRESEDFDNSRNDLIGLSYKGYFLATLVNSEDRRSYAAGIQRYWLTRNLRPDLTYQLGYRLGLIYGYDRKLGKYAAHIPVVPFPQFLFDLTWKHVGLELSYTWVVVSAGFYIRF